MKTVEFKFKEINIRPWPYEPEIKFNCIKDTDHSGVYVLASEAQERERVLHKVLRSALKSMENMCSYPEDHKLAIELIRAALTQVKGGGDGLGTTTTGNPGMAAGV